jgi:hypothetical protein
LAAKAQTEEEAAEEDSESVEVQAPWKVEGEVIGRFGMPLKVGQWKKQKQRQKKQYGSP